MLGAVELDGPVSLRFLPERRYRLLAYLALHGSWIARDQLAHLFWPDRTQEAARNNLRKLLFEVRALEPPQLESDRNGVRWIVRTDVAEYQTALAAGDQETALALYLGPLLHGLDGGDSDGFSAWLQTERERLHRAWRDAALVRLPHLAPAKARDLAQRLLDDDPFDEDAAVAALSASHAIGDGAGAARIYRAYAEHLIESLGVEPSARVRAVATAATGSAGTERLSAAASALAAQPAPMQGDFVGRARELAELASLLGQAECRLLTITGPGGMGKSRLVKHAVREVAQRYADGVSWIALDDLTDVVQIAPRIAAELKIELSAHQDPLERICQVLASQQKLLVLDNSEHLPTLSRLVESLLNAAPRLQLLTTSRMRVGGAREWLLPLSGLDGTPRGLTAAELLESDAARLFVAQARLVHPRFDAIGNATAISELVASVGGMPLAILLAAGWVRMLPVAELTAEVARSLDVLERAEEGEERSEHRSVRATFEQSWRLLAPAEQRALTALSVTAGGFTHIAAKAFANAPLPLLGALHDKSLLQSDRAGRFSLHPLIQQFAAEKLSGDSDAQSAAQRMHAEFFAQMLARHSDVRRAIPKLLIAEIGPELANCRLAWATLVAGREAKWLIMMAAPLKHYLQITGRVEEALTLLAQAEITLTGDDVLSRLAAATASRLGASALLLIGRVAEAQAKAESALPRCRALSDSEGTRSCINLIGLALWRAGRGAEATPHFEEVLRLAEAEGDLAAKAVALQNLSTIKSGTDQLDAAQALANRALEAHRIAGNVIGEVETLINLGNLWRRRGSYAVAAAVYREALTLSDQHGLATQRPFTLMNHAVSCLMTGDLAQAEVLYSDALVQARSAHVRQIEILALQGLGRTAVRRGDFGSAVEPLRAGLVLAQSEGLRGVAAEAVCYVAEWLAAQGERERAGLLLAVLLRLDLSRFEAMKLQSTLCLSQYEATAIDSAAARLDLDGAAAMALNLLSSMDPPVLTASPAR